MRSRGFTLIELVVGMVVLAIALTMITSVLTSQTQQQGQLWHQVRAAELGQTLLNEIVTRAFDENSPAGNSLQRCDQSGAPACIAQIPTCPASGMSSATEEAQRGQYDDVDDYHCLVESGESIQSSAGIALAALYTDYQVQVQVQYAGSELGVANRLIKRIDVTVVTPDGSPLVFSGYRGNW